MRRLLWDLRWALPWNRRLRQDGAGISYTPRPPSLSSPGETPSQFRDRLAWYLTDPAGYLRRERLP